MSDLIKNSESFVKYINANLSKNNSLHLNLYENEAGNICIRFRPQYYVDQCSVVPVLCISAECVQQFMDDPAFWTSNESTYVLMRELGENIFPITSLMSNSKKYYNEAFESSYVDLEELDDILHSTQFVSINMALNLDLINAINGAYVVKVTKLLASKFTTYTGKVYIDGLYSALNIFTMLFKQKFFSASFLVASKEPNDFNTWTSEKNNEGCGNLHNVRIEIDTTESPNDCADIQQTKVMFQSYCGFEWMGMRMQNEILIVQMKTINTHFVQPKQSINEVWIRTRVNDIQSSKCVDTNALLLHTKCLLESHNRNNARNSKDFPLINWANITK